ncbi:MAG: ATP synthase F1 subunit delta, partial [Janthinobacterium lividum]
MKDIRVAKRYAGALFAVADRNNVLDAVASDLELIIRFLAEVPYLRAIIMQPLVSDSRKNTVADEAFGDRVTASSLGFLKLLIRKRRESLIDECVREFRALLAEKTNT